MSTDFNQENAMNKEDAEKLSQITLNVKNAVKEIVDSSFPYSRREVYRHLKNLNPQTDLMTDLDLDSLDIITLGLALEDVFKRDIDLESEVSKRKVSTVEDVSKVVFQKVYGREYPTPQSKHKGVFGRLNDALFSKQRVD